MHLKKYKSELYTDNHNKKIDASYQSEILILILF